MKRPTGYGFALARVDDIDAPRLRMYRWYVTGTRMNPVVSTICGYGQKVGNISMSHIVLGLPRGQGITVRHINRDPYDFRRKNLRAMKDGSVFEAESAKPAQSPTASAKKGGK